MKKIFLLFAGMMLLLPLTRLAAQTTLDTAVNFHVKTIDGEPIWLFDLLDNDNKIVVIDFFSTSCGPCQFYAPDFQTSYEDFGSNNGNVYYMGINWGSNNQAVREFDSTYNLSYPTISGTQGGGNTVFEDYNILSYPTVIVIVPEDHLIVNKEIVPPVRDSINQAVTAAGGILVGVEEQQASALKTVVFPNPAGNYATVRILLKNQEKVAVAVYDLLGRVRVRVPEKVCRGGTIRIPLALENLSDGIYFVTVSFGGHTITRQLVKSSL
ncbi:MAG: hypothetical protein DRJ09_00055 [Bacteroidetes bacterium]|nr:MAG: hypothetical protein DRJ09_00055 [Bacteroidota bacterium]